MMPFVVVIGLFRVYLRWFCMNLTICGSDMPPPARGCLPIGRRGSLEHTSNSLQFVLYIADDLSVEEVHDPLSAGCILLRVGHHHDGRAFLVKFCEKVHHFLAVL